MKSTEEMQMRFEAVKDGKNWRVIDTTTGEIVAGFNSRRGLPASSLAFRATISAKEWNEAIEKFGQVQIGMTIFTKEEN
jgi:hypothetical protein